MKSSLHEVVYCKDCRDYLTPYCPCVERSQEDWYCADGIKKSEGQSLHSSIFVEEKNEV